MRGAGLTAIIFFLLSPVFRFEYSIYNCILLVILRVCTDCNMVDWAGTLVQYKYVFSVRTAGYVD